MRLPMPRVDSLHFLPNLPKTDRRLLGLVAERHPAYLSP